MTRRNLPKKGPSDKMKVTKESLYFQRPMKVRRLDQEDFAGARFTNAASSLRWVFRDEFQLISKQPLFFGATLIESRQRSCFLSSDLHGTAEKFYRGLDAGRKIVDAYREFGIFFP
jgi:hypothetical protein